MFASQHFRIALRRSKANGKTEILPKVGNKARWRFAKCMGGILVTLLMYKLG